MEPDLVLCFKNQGTNGEMEVLIQWRGSSPMEDTWEPFTLINQQFPDLHLEDKVTTFGRGGEGVN